MLIYILFFGQDICYTKKNWTLNFISKNPKKEICNPDGLQFDHLIKLYISLFYYY